MADNYSKSSKVLESGELSGHAKGGGKAESSTGKYAKSGKGASTSAQPDGSKFNPMNHKASTYGVNGV